MTNRSRWLTCGSSPTLCAQAIDLAGGAAGERPVGEDPAEPRVVRGRRQRPDERALVARRSGR